LSSQWAAAVVTNPLGDSPEGRHVLLFWLVRRQGVWLINKSDQLERKIADERLRGFLEAGDVHWHVQRDELVGHWEAGPGTPPAGGWIACGSRLQLSKDNRFRLVAWGPGGPSLAFDDVSQGTWRLAGDQILLTHKGQTHKCQITWMAGKLLAIQPANRKKYATEYERTGAPSKPAAAQSKLEQNERE